MIIKRLSWKANLLIGFILTILSGLNTIIQIETPNGLLTTHSDTLRFITFFIIGALIAKHRIQLVSFYQNLSLKLKIILFVSCFIFYTYSDLVILEVSNLILGLPYEFSIISEYGITLGSFGLIIMAMGSKKLIGILMRKPILFLGKISYSLYLFHFPVLLSLVYLLQGVVPLWLTFILIVIVSILVATATYYLIEEPSIKVGKYLANKNQTPIKTVEKIG